MKITSIKTLQMKRLPRVLWIILETDEGITGLGETITKPGVSRRMVHEVCSKFLLGKNPLDIEWHWNNMFRAFSSHGYAGADMRAVSGIDIALWDILGKYSGLPLYRLLGGACRDRIKIYNTWSLSDRNMLYKDAGSYAETLLSQGIDILKFSPLDEFSSPPFLGHYVSFDDLAKGHYVKIFNSIHKAVGDKLQVAIDMHGRYDAPTAIDIIHFLEPYNIRWIEDPVSCDNEEALAEVKANSKFRIAAGERLYTRFAFRRILEKRAVDLVIADLCWTGGITETKKIANMTETYELPFANHSYGGPVLSPPGKYSSGSPYSQLLGYGISP